MQSIALQQTVQSNGLYSIYTDQAQESMADEMLLAWDLTKEDAHRIFISFGQEQG